MSLSFNFKKTPAAPSSRPCFKNIPFYIPSFDLEDFKYNQVNMTAFRIVDGDNIKVKNVLQEMENLPEIGYKILNRTQVIDFIPVFLKVTFIKGMFFLFTADSYSTSIDV